MRYRTHNCGVLRKEQIGQQVTLSGWVHRRRDHGGLIFIDLRDKFGLTQVVFSPQSDSSGENAYLTADKLRSEWVILVEGKVIPRREGMANPKMATGEIEVAVSSLQILSKAKTPPFSVCDDDINVNEDLRLKYRYLDIRRGLIARTLHVRHKAMQIIRNFLSEKDFIEVSTPLLGKSTPEGARDYLVPSRLSPGHFYALPQSPQLFKQILMVSGMDRYFQIATCLRDEDLRANRQPEFTQIDLEMSFAGQEDLFPIIEKLCQAIFEGCLKVKIPTPFPRITYDECVAKYGTDKPDTRFGMPLHDVSDLAKQSQFTVFQEVLANGGIVKGLCVKQGATFSRKEIDLYTEVVQQLGVNGLAWMKRASDGQLTSSIVKFFSPELQQQLIARMGIEPNDLIFMVADTKNKTNQSLDHLRRKIARDLNLIQLNDYQFLWVTDFPLFQWNEEERRIESEHHPFTQPHFEDLNLIDSEPLRMRSSSYDLVLNGYEVASGSQRIHDGELQEKIFRTLKLTETELKERFGFFIEALSYGTPPHLGIALGLDRVIMVLTETENIRDVIAFPKNSKGSDLMSEAPSTVSSDQLDELQIRVEETKIAWS